MQAMGKSDRAEPKRQCSRCKNLRPLKQFTLRMVNDRAVRSVVCETCKEVDYLVAKCTEGDIVVYTPQGKQISPLKDDKNEFELRTKPIVEMVFVKVDDINPDYCWIRLKSQPKGTLGSKIFIPHLRKK